MLISHLMYCSFFIADSTKASTFNPISLMDPQILMTKSCPGPNISLDDFYCLFTLYDVFLAVYGLIIVIIIVPAKPRTLY